jgi:diacylglycerol kinase family enzyme
MEADQNLKVTDPMPSSWTVIEADFVLFWASQVTHPGKSTFLCPSLTFGNGTITIMMVRAPVSRWQMVRILWSLETGSHATLPGVEWVTCRQFRLVPDRHDVSYNDIDGEEAVRGPVQAMVEPKQLRYLGNGGGR